MSDSGQTDEEIVALIQRGNAEQFGELMQRYEAKLTRYGMRFLNRGEDVGDLVQDIFVQTYQNIQGFDTTQRFSPWIYRIAHNAFVNELRRRTHRPIVIPDFDLLLSHAPSAELADVESEHNALKKMVEAGLSKVQPKFREILILYFMEELSYKEIADVLRIPIGTVGVRLTRAKRALREAYAALNIQYVQ